MTQINNVALFTKRIKNVTSKLTTLLGEKEFGSASVTSRILSVIDSFNSNMNSNNGSLAISNSNLLTSEGKIRVALATNNSFKRKDFELYFDVNYFGSAIKELFEIVEIDKVKDTDENIYSFKENALGKALENMIPNAFVIGDDSGIILPEMSKLLTELREVIFEHSDEVIDPRSGKFVDFVDNTLLPGVVSKRFSEKAVVEGIAHLTTEDGDASVVIDQLTAWRETMSGKDISVSTQNIFTICAFADLINILLPPDDFSNINAFETDHVAILQSTLQGVVTDENGKAVYRMDTTSGIRGVLRLPKLPRHISNDLYLQDEYFKSAHAYNSVFWLPEHQKFLCDLSYADCSQVDHRGDAFGDLLASLICNVVPFNFMPFVDKVNERIHSIATVPLCEGLKTFRDVLSVTDALVIESSAVTVHPQSYEEGDTSVVLDYDDGTYYKSIDLDAPVEVLQDNCILVDGEKFSLTLITRVNLGSVNPAFTKFRELFDKDAADHITLVVCGTTLYPQTTDYSNAYIMEDDNGVPIVEISKDALLTKIEHGIYEAGGCRFRIYKSTLLDF